MLRVFDCCKPVIAAINGPAVGVGATMTLPMDVRLASEEARIGFVFARRGIVPEACSSWFLPRIVGISQALEWCLTARLFGADEALSGGLVRSIHPADQVLDVAKGLAAEIATNAAPVSAALTRQMLWRMLGADHPMEAHKVDSRAIFSTGRAAFFAALSTASAGRVDAHKVSASPTKTAPALASCAFDKPKITLGLRRINSTRKRAVPLRTRYSPRIQPAGRGLLPRNHSQAPIRSPAPSS